MGFCAVRNITLHFLLAFFSSSIFLFSSISPAHSDEIFSQNGNCQQSACLFLKYDSTLNEEALLLADTLRRRLCNQGVTVVSESQQLDNNPLSESEFSEKTTCDIKKVAQWWVAHLKILNTSYVLLAVDHLGSESNDDLIREIPKGPDSDATAWTLALMIEEAILPYTEESRDRGPVGAGLAIIEPQEVAGEKRQVSRSVSPYPLLQSLWIGLTMYYLGLTSGYIEGLLIGPAAGINGLLGPRFLASLSTGWMGSGRFEDDFSRTKGTVSYIPINIIFGYIVLRRNILNLSILAGISAGFALYQSQSAGAESQRTFVFFDPQLQGGLDFSFQLFGPLAFYINSFFSFPVRIDVLQNNGHTVYKQDWIIPVVGGGLRLQI